MALTVQIQKRYGDFLLDVDFTAEEFRTKFLEAHPEADFSGPAGNWLSDP